MPPVIDALYAFGSNGAGQLNVGHDEDLSEPTPCLISGPCSDVSIIGSGNHTFVQADDKIYLVGKDEPLYVPEFAIRSSMSGVHEFSNVGLFAATWDAFAVVSKDANGQGRSIYTFGSSDKGQLGRPQESSASVSSLSRVVELPPPLSAHAVIDVVGGVQHFVAVLDSGDVVGWGNGRKGQLGDPAGIIEKPRKVEGVDFKVKKAFCGREFTYLLGDPGEGKHLVLGADKWNIKSRAPDHVKSWVAAGAGWGSISVLLTSGKVVSWGRNDHGQLAPTGLPLLTNIAVGSEHTVALSTDGQILVWGWGEHGNCGSEVDDHGDVKDRWNVVQLPASKTGVAVRGLGAGCATSWVWTGQAEST